MTSETASAAAAGTWKLGDREVNRLGYGSMRLTGIGMRGGGDGRADGSAGRDRDIDRDVAVAVLRRAVDLGVNHIDTAGFYFSPLRSSNELINRALAPYPDDLVIVTKVGPRRGPSGEWLPPAAPGELRGQVEENLRQLGRDHLDVVNLRRMGQDSIAEHFGALAELRDAGHIRDLGISSVKPEHLAEAQAIAPVVCVQNWYGLDRRLDDANGLVDRCREQGIAYVPFFAIAGDRREASTDTDTGLNADAGASTDAGTGTGDAHGDELRAVARAHGATPAQVRLAWTLHRGPHVLAIPGTGNPDHLGENVAAAELRLSPDELARLTP
jgi:aryl-alcohol dehydrogenase-like predicted oxidoreductase